MRAAKRERLRDPEYLERQANPHAYDRFRERLGPGIMPSAIAQRIDGGDFVERWWQNKRVTLNVVVVENVIQVFVYDIFRKIVVTVLPECDIRVKEMRQKYRPNRYGR